MSVLVINQFISKLQNFPQIIDICSQVGFFIMSQLCKQSYKNTSNTAKQ